ncbi:MAG TPA: hypothetical protein V6D10_07275 [Trichocoleus sp.]|jgi:hypothetical protein
MAGEKADKDKKRVQRQSRLTFTDAEWQFIKDISDLMGTTDGDVIQFGFRLGSRPLADHVAFLRKRPIAYLPDAKTLLTRLASGEWIDDGELCDLAHTLDMELEVLIALRNRVGQRSSDAAPIG